MNQSRLFGRFLAVLSVLMLLASGNANADPSYSTVADPQLATGNGLWSSTRLNAHDRVVIEAPINTDGLTGVCRSVLNNSGQDIFVPWYSKREWNSFLSAAAAGNGALSSISVGSCCRPQTATVCDLPYPSAANPTQLGYRVLGTNLKAGSSTTNMQPVDTTIASGTKATWGGNNWGAETDILGPLSSTIANSNYQVTYVCSGGQWVKTHEIGSCVPLAGACSGLNNTYVTSFPTSNLDAALCGTGSTLLAGPFQTANGWNWTCNGGLSVASCQAYSKPPVNAACGTINNYGNTGPTYTLAQLLSLPLGSVCSSGTLNSVGFVNNGGNALDFTWTCSGSNGGSDSGTCAALSQSVNASCGSDNGNIYTTLTPPPTSGLCGASGEIPVGPIYNIATKKWTWTCLGIGSGLAVSNCSSTYDANYSNGNCGPDYGQYFPVGSLNVNSPGLCNGGTVQQLTNYPPGTNYWGWTWECQGVDGGNSNWCGAYDQNAVNGTCGSDANQVINTLTSTDPNLCATGSSANFYQTNNAWGWSCNGASSGGTQWCSAAKNSTLSGAQCGGAAGGTYPTAPSSGLCTLGNASVTSKSADGLFWLWSCTSQDTTETASCSATVALPAADGACGLSNNTAIPNTPNTNLCATGTASAIAGNGPWTWTCLGISGGITSGVCQAQVCNACTGTTSRNQSTARTVNANSCTISGNEAWTEIDALIAGSAATKTVTIGDQFGSVSSTVTPAAAPYPTYCPPCYEQAQGVSSAGLTITSLSGSCGGYSTGQFIPATGSSVQ